MHSVPLRNLFPSGIRGLISITSVLISKTLVSVNHSTTVNMNNICAEEEGQIKKIRKELSCKDGFPKRFHGEPELIIKTSIISFNLLFFAELWSIGCGSLMNNTIFQTHLCKKRFVFSAPITSNHFYL